MSVILTGTGMPRFCKECPCKYFTEGAWLDFCQAINTEIKEETAVLDNCPMKTVDGLIEKIENSCCITVGRQCDPAVTLRDVKRIIKDYCKAEG